MKRLRSIRPTSRKAGAEIRLLHGETEPAYVVAIVVEQLELDAVAPDVLVDHHEPAIAERRDVGIAERHVLAARDEVPTASEAAGECVGHRHTEFVEGTGQHKRVVEVVVILIDPHHREATAFARDHAGVAVELRVLEHKKRAQLIALRVEDARHHFRVRGVIEELLNAHEAVRRNLNELVLADGAAGKGGTEPAAHRVEGRERRHDRADDVVIRSDVWKGGGN